MALSAQKLLLFANVTARIGLLVKTLTTIYRGATVGVDTTVGYAMGAVEQAGMQVQGVAIPNAAGDYDNSAGADGAIGVIVYQGEFERSQDGSITQVHVGQQAWLVDDETVSLAPGANTVKCGQITKYVSATSVYVQIVPGWI